VRWQPFAVTAALLAPPVLLAAAVWPDGGIGGGGGIEAELGEGDSETSTTDGLSSTDFLVVGPGQLRIDVAGGDFDTTLTLVDADSGEHIAFNDDVEGWDPSLVVELDEGASVRAQVRSFDGSPGRFVISVSAADDAPELGEGAGAGGTVAPPPLLPGQSETTIVAG
jgi:hypothetical protein